ncbi:MAG TPA: CBS domain-containing protein [Candidatus Dormibacteraeota bacterium]
MTWTVSDVMTKGPVVIGPDARFKTCARLIEVHKLEALPVVAADGTLLGIVSEADLTAGEAARPPRGRTEPAGGGVNASTVGELMNRELVTTTPDAPLTTAASLMFERHLQVLPVVDDAKRLVGILGRSQILTVFLRSDESIRRDVARELRLVPEVIRGDVEAEVKEGVVHLYGGVPKESATELLTGIVTAIPGVVGVVSEFKPVAGPAGQAGGGDPRE